MLAFIDKRTPISAKELTAAEREQLQLAWLFYCGEKKTADELVAENSGWFEHWTVTRDGKPVFDYWHLPPDTGALFHAAKPSPTGIGVIQFSWDLVKDHPLTKKVPNTKHLLKDLTTAWKAAGGIAGDVDDNDNVSDSETKAKPKPKPKPKTKVSVKALVPAKKTTAKKKPAKRR